MEKPIFIKAREFLTSYLSGKENVFETVHPWRKSWEFVLHHSFRVEEYAYRILKEDNKVLSDEDTTVVILACILHDIGRLHSRKEHAHIGAEIVRKWFEDNPDLETEVPDKQKLIYIIENHSDKMGDDNDYLLNLVRDADVLDEIGVMSIMMSTNWVNKSSPHFFYELHDRIKSYETCFCEKEANRLYTNGAKKILERKKGFIHNFIEELEYELEGTEKVFEYVPKKGFFLIEPSQEYEIGFKRFAKDFKDFGEKEHAKLYKESLENFEKYLLTLEDYKKGINLPKGWTYGHTFWLTDTTKLVYGVIRIRPELYTEHSRRIAGNIGYDVSPLYRKKGLGTTLLKLGLEKSRDLGLKKLLVTCRKNNPGSKKVIENNGGIFESEVIDDEGKIHLRYWINL